jgi:hypothetical protein
MQGLFQVDHLPFDSEIEDISQDDNDASNRSRRVLLAAHFVRQCHDELRPDFIEEVTV